MQCVSTLVYCYIDKSRGGPKYIRSERQYTSLVVVSTLKYVSVHISRTYLLPVRFDMSGSASTSKKSGSAESSVKKDKRNTPNTNPYNKIVIPNNKTIDGLVLKLEYQ